MLSETDVQYIVGFLYVVSRREDIQVMLGDKIYDEAAGKKRDVDIVIVSVGNTGMIGVEVKDEKRPLDVIVVESICQKFADMPSITKKSIVSSSGFTAPAKKKANKHGVECLKIIRGSVPSFGTVDMSHVKEVTTERQVWVDGPEIILMPNMKIDNSISKLILPTTPVIYGSEIKNKETINVQTLVDNIVKQIVEASNNWNTILGNNPVYLDIQIGDKPTILINNNLKIEVTEARVLGAIKLFKEIIPLKNSCYLEDPFGNPFAGAIIFELDGDLIGLSVSIFNQELRSFSIPKTLRKIRPTRKNIYSR